MTNEPINNLIDKHLIAQDTIIDLIDENIGNEVDNKKYRAVNRFISGFIADLQNLKELNKL